MAFSDERAYEEPHQFGNIIEVREKNIVEDFDSALQQPLFDLKASRPLVVIMKYVVEGEDPRQREVVDYGGPKIHVCTSMLDNFVYHRLNLLSSTGKFPHLFGFSDEDWKRDLVTAGKVSAISIVQCLVCPWYILKAYEGIMKDPVGRHHPFIIGLQLHDATEILENAACRAAYINVEVNPQLVMDSLDWEFNVSEVFFLRDLEQSNKAWFRSWLEKIEKGIYPLVTLRRDTTRIGKK